MLLFYFFFCVSTAITNHFSYPEEYTIKHYTNTPPLLFSAEQNRYWSLPEFPSEIVNGINPINMTVPTSLENFVWRLSGYFRANATGIHEISIGETDSAKISIGPKFVKLYASDESPLVHREEFVSLPETRNMEQDSHYHMVIEYVAKKEKAQVFYMPPDGISELLHPYIHQLEQNPGNEEAYTINGFLYEVYLIPEDISPKSALEDHSKLTSLSKGLFDRPDNFPLLNTTQNPHITEIYGHFKPPVSGKYLIKMEDAFSGALQVGPPVTKMGQGYKIDKTWKLLDSRFLRSSGFMLDGSYMYPFRMVIFGDERPSHFGVTVRDPERNLVNLFGIRESSEILEVFPEPVNRSNIEFPLDIVDEKNIPLASLPDDSDPLVIDNDVDPENVSSTFGDIHLELISDIDKNDNNVIDKSVESSLQESDKKVMYSFKRPDFSIAQEDNFEESGTRGVMFAAESTSLSASLEDSVIPRIVTEVNASFVDPPEESYMERYEEIKVDNGVSLKLPETPTPDSLPQSVNFNDTRGSDIGTTESFVSARMMEMMENGFRNNPTNPSSVSQYQDATALGQYIAKPNDENRYDSSKRLKNFVEGQNQLSASNTETDIWSPDSHSKTINSSGTPEANFKKYESKDFSGNREIIENGILKDGVGPVKGITGDRTLLKKESEPDSDFKFPSWFYLDYSEKMNNQADAEGHIQQDKKAESPFETNFVKENKFKSFADELAADFDTNSDLLRAKGETHLGSDSSFIKNLADYQEREKSIGAIGDSINESNSPELFDDTLPDPHFPNPLTSGRKSGNEFEDKMGKMEQFDHPIILSQPNPDQMKSEFSRYENSGSHLGVYLPSVFYTLSVLLTEF